MYKNKDLSKFDEGDIVISRSEHLQSSRSSGVYAVCSGLYLPKVNTMKERCENTHCTELAV